MTTFSELIRQMATSIGLPAEDEYASPLEFSLDGYPVVLSHLAGNGAGEVVVYARLGTVPAERELEVYRLLLEANVLWSATSDGTIGVRSDTREAMLAYRAPVDALDGERLAVLLGVFVEAARNWSNFMEAANDQAAALPEVPSFGSGMGGFIRG